MGRNRLLIHGKVGGGKTTLIKKIVNRAKERGLIVEGILSPRLMRGGKTVGYDVKSVGSGLTKTFALTKRELRDSDLDEERTISFPSDVFNGMSCKYYFVRSTIEWVNVQIGKLGCTRDPDILIIDEIGFLELKGNGFTGAIELLREADRLADTTIVTTRDFLVDQVEGTVGGDWRRIYLKEDGKHAIEEVWGVIKDRGDGSI